MKEAKYRELANEGFNEWLASLPDDDWGDSFENAVPIYWDEQTGQWCEGG
jgi:hypothetical protein